MAGGRSDALICLFFAFMGVSVPLGRIAWFLLMAPGANYPYLVLFWTLC